MHKGNPKERSWGTPPAHSSRIAGKPKEPPYILSFFVFWLFYSEFLSTHSHPFMSPKTANGVHQGKKLIFLKKIFKNLQFSLEFKFFSLTFLDLLVHAIRLRLSNIVL